MTNTNYDLLSQGFGYSKTAVILHHFLKKNDYDLSHIEKDANVYGEIVEYSLTSLDYDWSMFSIKELGKQITFNSIDDIENDTNVKTQAYLFIEKLLNERKLMSVPVKVTRHFLHEHLEKFCQFNNNPYTTLSCTEDSHDIVNTQYIQVSIVLTKRITLEKFMDYLKFPEKYDKKISELRDKHFGKRKQTDFS